MIIAYLFLQEQHRIRPSEQLSIVPSEGGFRENSSFSEVDEPLSPVANYIKNEVVSSRNTSVTLEDSFSSPFHFSTHHGLPIGTYIILYIRWFGC